MEFWARLDEDFPDYQTALLDDGEVVAKGCSIPSGGTRQTKNFPQRTGLPMPGTGHYVVPRALAPTDVDHEHDLVSYTGPNVWVRHEVR
jgi:hypothetical protein